METRTLVMRKNKYELKKKVRIRVDFKEKYFKITDLRLWSIKDIFFSKGAKFR